MKLAFLFPGQGAQYVGMGQDLVEGYRVARETFAEADRALGWDLSGLCFHGPEARLQETEYTQPAILAHSVACWRVVAEYGLRADYLAGLSLGEYTALVTAGSLDFATALQLVQRRGRYMQEAVPLGQGSMAAVMGLDRDDVEQICAMAQGLVAPANYNCPGQIVISGETQAVQEAGRLALARGAQRVVPLAVSAPFHSVLMQPAADRLAGDLAQVEMSPWQVPVIANVNAQPYQTVADLVPGLVAQVVSPVRWEDSMRLLLAEGVQVFVELGPGRTLAGFLRKLNRDVQVFSVSDLKTLQKLLDFVSEGLL
ncbi:MAG TPA: ACP S-malonyltransferase [Firmicutes bacterium]|jgi:[acyl-carrier-protein] S-malonyltransferase|nr:ACP S-malonyltransferase [Bacillota bacterium]